MRYVPTLGKISPRDVFSAIKKLVKVAPNIQAAGEFVSVRCDGEKVRGYVALCYVEGGPEEVAVLKKTLEKVFSRFRTGNLTLWVVPKLTGVIEVAVEFEAEINELDKLADTLERLHARIYDVLGGRK